jgi:16S rRNA (uracil1498-N3)-methyltransferase
MQLFYCPGILKNELSLTDEEAQHCARVLRKKAGDLIQITDGQGSFYRTRLKEITSKKCHFEILERTNLPGSDYTVHIAIAPTKNIDRTEWFVEKATEIGINEISFIISAHSERDKVNLERMEKKAVSAIKQSVRPFLPRINPIQKLPAFLSHCSDGEKFVAHLDDESSAHLSNAAPRSADYVVLIGPEGGFSDDEIASAKHHGFLSVKLGENRLRTETAGVMACAILNTLNLP